MRTTILGQQYTLCISFAFNKTMSLSYSKSKKNRHNSPSGYLFARNPDCCYSTYIRVMKNSYVSVFAQLVLTRWVNKAQILGRMSRAEQPLLLFAYCDYFEKLYKQKWSSSSLECLFILVVKADNCANVTICSKCCENVAGKKKRLIFVKINMSWQG